MKDTDLIFDFCVESIDGQRFFILSADVNWQRQVLKDEFDDDYFTYEGERIQRTAWHESMFEEADFGVPISPRKTG